MLYRLFVVIIRSRSFAVFSPFKWLERHFCTQKTDFDFCFHLNVALPPSLSLSSSSIFSALASYPSLPIPSSPPPPSLYRCLLHVLLSSSSSSFRSCLCDSLSVVAQSTRRSDLHAQIKADQPRARCTRIHGPSNAFTGQFAIPTDS